MFQLNGRAGSTGTLSHNHCCSEWKIHGITKEMCIHSQNLHTSSGCISSDLRAVLRHGGLSAPEPAGEELSSAELTRLLCSHTEGRGQRTPRAPLAHPSRTHTSV